MTSTQIKQLWQAVKILEDEGFTVTSHEIEHIIARELKRWVEEDEEGKI